MIKGVNRHIIEITETKSDYYERAMLVIKPQYEAIERELLEKEAKKVLKDLGAPSSINKNNKVLYWMLRLVPTAILGAAITVSIMMIF